MNSGMVRHPKRLRFRKCIGNMEPVKMLPIRIYRQQRKVSGGNLFRLNDLWGSEDIGRILFADRGSEDLANDAGRGDLKFLPAELLFPQCP